MKQVAVLAGLGALALAFGYARYRQNPDAALFGSRTAWPAAAVFWSLAGLRLSEEIDGLRFIRILGLAAFVASSAWLVVSLFTGPREG